MTTLRTIRLPDDCERIALCGGPYSNFAAVEAFLAATAGMPRFCLGDLGGFGPLPDRTLDRVRASGMTCLQGNYDHAVGFDERDCGCGYLDPERSRTAQISFDYTASHTSAHHKAWLRELPSQVLSSGAAHACCSSTAVPTSVNEFVWEQRRPATPRSTRWLARERVDAHLRDALRGAVDAHAPRTVSGATSACSAGPRTTARARVGYALVHFAGDTTTPHAELVPLDYDVAPVAAAIRAEGLPEAFARRARTRRLDHLRDDPARRGAAAVGSLRDPAPSPPRHPRKPHARHAAPAQAD